MSRARATRRADRGRPPRPRGFTLIEVLIAIALVMALLAAMFAFSWDLLATREQIVTDIQRRRAAATLVEHLERDLMTSIVGDDVVGAGVAGDGTSLQLFSRGVPVRLSRGAAEAGPFADLETSAYRYDAAQRTIVARRSVRSPGGDDREGGPEHPLGGDLGRVRFRYHDGEGWRDAFDSRAAGRLPRAVEVAVWFEPPGDDGAEADTAPGDDWLDAEPWEDADPAPMSEDERAPDRVRLIVVPDAEAAEAAEEPAEDDPETAP